MSFFKINGDQLLRDGVAFLNHPSDSWIIEWLNGSQHCKNPVTVFSEIYEGDMTLFIVTGSIWWMIKDDGHGAVRATWLPHPPFNLVNDD